VDVMTTVPIESIVTGAMGILRTDDDKRALYIGLIRWLKLVCYRRLACALWPKKCGWLIGAPCVLMARTKAARAASTAHTHTPQASAPQPRPAA